MPLEQMALVNVFQFHIINNSPPYQNYITSVIDTASLNN
jgi:hypothetical protein